MTTLRALFFAALAGGLLVPTTAAAKKAKPACDIDYLPFVEGTTWVYQYAVPPDVEEQPGNIRATPPETFELSVQKIETDGKSTRITLVEKYRAVSHETVLECTKDKLVVPLDSFFFAGEVGGILGAKVSNIAFKGESEFYPGKGGLKTGDTFFVELKAEIDRTASEGTKVEHPKALLEVERQVTVRGTEDVELDLGLQRARRVEVAMTGRAAVAAKPDKQQTMPDGMSVLWFTPKVGLVRAYNRLGQGWELKKVTVPE